MRWLVTLQPQSTHRDRSAGVQLTSFVPFYSVHGAISIYGAVYLEVSSLSHPVPLYQFLSCSLVLTDAYKIIIQRHNVNDHYLADGSGFSLAIYI